MVTGEGVLPAWVGSWASHYLRLPALTPTPGHVAHPWSAGGPAEGDASHPEPAVRVGLATPGFVADEVSRDLPVVPGRRPLTFGRGPPTREPGRLITNQPLDLGRPHTPHHSPGLCPRAGGAVAGA